MKLGRKRKYDFGSLKVGEELQVENGNVLNLRSVAMAFSTAHKQKKWAFEVTEKSCSGRTFAIVKRVKNKK